MHDGYINPIIIQEQLRDNKINNMENNHLICARSYIICILYLKYKIALQFYTPHPYSKYILFCRISAYTRELTSRCACVYSLYSGDTVAHEKWSEQHLRVSRDLWLMRTRTGARFRATIFLPDVLRKMWKVFRILVVKSLQ